MFKKVIKFYLTSFLQDHDFKLINNANGSFKYEHNTQLYQIVISNHPRKKYELVNFFEIDIVQFEQNNKIGVNLGMLHFALNADLFSLPFCPWYYADEEELIGAINKVKEVFINFCISIINGAKKMDFLIELDKWKEKYSELLKRQYNGKDYEYSIKVTLPQSEYLKKIRFK